MKIKGKNLGIIFVVIGILLIAGCVNEEKKEGTPEITCNKPYIKVGSDCCLDKDNNSICDKDEAPAETKTGETEEKPAGVKPAEKVTETIPEQIEIDERGKVETQCHDWTNYADYRGGGTVAVPNDLKQYKGRWMCHNRYSLQNGGWVDLYWTKYEEEVYKVTTNPDGTVDEVKSGSSAGSKNETDVCVNITDLNKKNDCYVNLAVSKGDPLICNPLLLEVHDRCYKELAVSQKNILLCDRIGNVNAKDDCYVIFALFEGDSLICGKIKNQDKRDDCYNRHVAN